MKKTRSLLVVLMTLALLVSLVGAMGITASAAETITDEYDFSGMEKIAEGADSDGTAANKATVKAKLEGLGLYEVENLMLGGNYETMVTPGGYAGYGHYIHKLEAPAGKYLSNVKLDLSYWICNAEPIGSIEVFVSADGVSESLVWSDSEGKGTWAADLVRSNKVIDIPVAAEQSVVYVKVRLCNWSTYEGAAVSITKLSATCGTNEPVDGPINSVADFTAMTPVADVAGTTAALKGIGLVDASGLTIQDCIRIQVTPNGGFEDAWYIQKLDCGDGKVFQDAPVLKLDYSLAATSDQDPNYTPGYVKVAISTDGTTYTEVFVDNQGEGKDWDPSAAINKEIELEAAKGQQVVYVKVIINRHGGPVAASVLKSVINGAAGDPISTDNGGSDNTGDMIGIVAALVVVCGLGLVVTDKKIRKF